MSSAPAGLHRLLLTRERGIVMREDALAFQRSLHFPAYFASKLNVEHTYEGHNGCVNRLGWNADGSLLVSGSDDRRALIWHYPDVERPPLALSTEHRANIFGCQFLPCTGDRRIVTGAMDDTVQLHDLEASPAAAGAAAAARAAGRQGSAAAAAGGGGGGVRHRRTAASSSHLQLVTPRTKVYLSHKDRVKDVKVEPMNPHNFWSGGEDGDVRQYDTRVPNQDKWESPTVFVQVRDGHRTVQVKSLDINKAHPHLMAVAGSDPYIRLYDRRKLGTGPWKRRGATPAVMLLAPPHLPLARHGRAHATYVSFSNRGDKVVTTYHGDHAYCFDITAAGDMAALFPQPPAAAPRQPPGRLAGGRGGMGPAAWGGGEAGGSGRSSSRDDSLSGRAGWSGRSGSGGSGSSVLLPSRAEEAKARGNAATFERQWPAAVKAFSEALYFAPGAPALYAMRAEALLRRGWVGDAALALRDCDTAVALDEGCSRAFLSRIQALQALQQYQCALTAVDEYRRRFPGRAADDVAKLMSQLRASVDERRRLYEARRQQQERRRVQRAAEALARTPRRVATSPPPRGRRPGTADAGAGAVANTSTSAAGAGAAGAGAAATSPRRGSGPKAGPGAAATAAAAGAAAEAAEAATEPTANNAAAERLAADGAAPMDVTELEVGPPPPPPSPPPYPAAHLPDASPTAAAAAAGAPAAGPSSVAGPLDRMDDGAEPPATTAAAAVNGVAAASASAGVMGPPGCDSAPPGPATPGEAEGRLEGVWEEAEEVDGRPNDSGDVAAGDDGDEEEEEEEGEAEDGEDQDEGDEEDAGEGPARGQSYGEYGSEDEEEDELEMLSREGDGVEEDPDLELFLQYYAQAMELASSGSSSGASASGGTSTGTGASTPRASSRPLGGEPQGSGSGSGSGGRALAAPRAAAARHVPGAWGGSAGGRRMLQRYVGQCNVQTDIKEVNFVGSDDRVVAAGSDCGRVFLYDADSGAVLRALPADEDVANCVQCHPTLPVLATSGIENVIRLWSPRDAPPAAAAVSELDEELTSVVERNQARMKEGPSVFRPSVLQDALQENPQLLHLFMSQLYGRGIVAGRGARAGGAGTGSAGGGGGGGGEDEVEEEDEDGPPGVSCRMA